MFKVGKPVINDDFIGRKEQLFKLQTNIENNNSVVLIAPRRYGKTSLILELKNHIDINFIHIDLMNTYTKRDFSTQIISQCYSIAGIHGVLEQFKSQSLEFFKKILNHLSSLKITIDDLELETAQKLLSDKDDDELIDFALNLPQKIAKKLDIDIVFVIDELGEIVKFTKSDELLQKMRSIFQLQSKITFLFAGSQYHLMNKIFDSSSSAFFRFANIIHVPPLNIKEYQQFLINRFKKNGITLTAANIELIHSVTNGLPYYIMRLANEIYFYAKLQNSNITKYAILKIALGIVEDESSFISLELSKIKGKKYFIEVLKAIAKKQNPYEILEAIGVRSQNINKIINELKEYGLVAKENNNYIILDPIIKYYLQKKTYR